MHTFFRLLPFRIEQKLGPLAMRATRTRLLRRATSSSARPVPDRRRRLFIDVAVISKEDAGTGIQRVVGALAAALAREASSLWDVHFVSARRRRRYFVTEYPSVGDEQPVGEEMRAVPGDVFLGLDYSLDAVRQHRAQLRRFRRAGGSVWFLVHDLLPLQRPEWFSRNMVIRYRAWLCVLASVSDGFLCNSPQTERELREALASTYRLHAGYRTRVLPMGHEFPTRPSLMPQPAIDRSRGLAPFALMVGTVEPRKGHADVIAAFEHLWKNGCQHRLVVVGRGGWHVESLMRYIRSHPEFGIRLFWFDDVEDAELVRIYDACTGVIIGSHGEGFGLPLIEALGRRKPVIARDLPVFRMHEGTGVWFFARHADPRELGDAIRDWLRAAAADEIHVRLPTGSWFDSARVALTAIGES